MSQLKLKEQSKTFTEDLKKCQIGFWVDSAGGPKQLCNNSFYGTEPAYWFYGSLNKVYFNHNSRNKQTELFKINCFNFLDQKIKEEKRNSSGIFVGYVSYDLFHRTNPQNLNYPNFFFAYFENIKPTSLRAYEPMNLQTYEPTKQHALIQGHISSNMTDEEYFKKVNLIKEEIKVGNVYQVNLTRQYLVQMNDTDDLELYLKLRSVSPNPYACYLKTPFVSILSSSPEEFIYIEPKSLRAYEPKDLSTHRNSSYIRTRPIKGTLPKGVFKIDPKNKAENIMIVDLERNDLGKICKYGTIRAKKLLELEEYKHLNHVVSTVEGELKENISLKEIFESIFPGGSITGAPKIAAMNIINRLEPTKRGAYTGCFGYIKMDGTMSFNILIRTIFVQKVDSMSLRAYEPMNLRLHKQRITFNVGGGIVADSDPQAELEEVKLKAKGILSALNLSIA